jgi:hypothetical protein
MIQRNMLMRTWMVMVTPHWAISRTDAPNSSAFHPSNVSVVLTWMVMDGMMSLMFIEKILDFGQMLMLMAIQINLEQT